MAEPHDSEKTAGSKANLAHQDRIFSRKALAMEELFDYGPTFNDVTMSVSSFYHYRKIFDRIIERPEDRVLEIGCHTGKNLRYIAEKTPGVQTIGLDISILSLQKAGTNNVHGTRFLAGAAELFPFRDGTMDAVLCMDLLEHLDHPEACLAEAARVLREGGRIAIKCPIKDNRWTLDAYRRWRDPAAWRKKLFEVGHDEARLLDSGELVRLLEKEGFRVVQKIYFDLFIQNLYDYWFLPAFLPKIKSWLRIAALRPASGGGPASGAGSASGEGSAGDLREAAFEIPQDPEEIARIRERLARRIAVKKRIAGVVLPLVRLLAAPERLLSRLGIGATIYVIAVKARAE